MAKRGKKYRDIMSPSVAGIVPFTAEEHESHYKRDYEFNARVPVRSPLSGWEHKYTVEGNSNNPPKEIALVRGAPAKNSHRRDGNSYGKRPTRRNLGAARSR